MCKPFTSKCHVYDVDKQHNDKLQRGFYWAAASITFWLMANNMGLPYTQDKRNALGCDSMCQGSMNSARSTLTLLGATLVGRLSDATWLDPYGGGRRVCLGLGLLATAASLVLTSQATSLSQLWQSLLPQLLQQNISVIKALFSDYHVVLQSSATQQASTAGLLGMVGGIAMMSGPLIGSYLLSNIHQATLVSLLALLLAAACICFVPSIPSQSRPKPINNNTTSSGNQPNFWSMLDVPSARSPPALFLLTCRCLSTVSFHIFSTFSTPALKQRFDFGPTEYGQFFSFIGFCFALSQYFAPILLRHTSASRKSIFVTALAVVGIGRYLAFTTPQLYAMYALYAATVLATGVIATLFAADTSQVASPDEAGAFFGVVATIESGAGMVGPLIGGSLAKLPLENKTLAPLMVTTSLTAVVGTMVWFGYEPMLSKISRSANKTD